MEARTTSAPRTPRSAHGSQSPRFVGRAPTVAQRPAGFFRTDGDMARLLGRHAVARYEWCAMNWKKEVGIAFLVRQRHSELFPVWPLRYPSVAATADDIATAERIVGPLDSEYVGFLQAANGWEAFQLNIDLFGTGDLMGSSRMARARELLSELPLQEHSDVAGEDVLPVGSSADSIDVVLLGPSREPSQRCTGGPVN